MAYEKHNFVDGDILTAQQLNEIDNQIEGNAESIELLLAEIESLKSLTIGLLSMNNSFIVQIEELQTELNSIKSSYVSFSEV